VVRSGTGNLEDVTVLLQAIDNRERMIALRGEEIRPTVLAQRTTREQIGVAAIE
jgi:hypothetical protein